MAAEAAGQRQETLDRIRALVRTVTFGERFVRSSAMGPRQRTSKSLQKACPGSDTMR